MVLGAPATVGRFQRLGATCAVFGSHDGHRATVRPGRNRSTAVGIPGASPAAHHDAGSDRGIGGTANSLIGYDTDHGFRVTHEGWFGANTVNGGADKASHLVD